MRFVVNTCSSHKRNNDNMKYEIALCNGWLIFPKLLAGFAVLDLFLWLTMS